MSSFEIFQSRIKETREENGLTQKEFSEMIGFSQQTLSGYENGRTTPSLEAIAVIAQKCNVTIDWLCGLSDQKNTNDEINTYADLFKLFIKLYKGFEFSLETQNDPITYEHNTTIFTFTDEVMPQFIDDWMNMLVLINSQSIDNELYSMWIEKTLPKYDIPLKKGK